jgi:hypothetical protein
MCRLYDNHNQHTILLIFGLSFKATTLHSQHLLLPHFLSNK